METRIIKKLSNEEYHRSKEYSEYISSSQLRKYLTSPAEYKRSLEDKQETTPAMELGSFVHDALEYIHITGDYSLSSWSENMAVFEPPVNPKTKQPYGATTFKYLEAYQEFLETTDGKKIVSKDNLDIAHAIARSAENHDFVRRIILNGDAEFSHFIEHEGLKWKWRPDLELTKSIIDWKTINGNLDDETIRKRILDSYAVQAAFYQYFTNLATGVWKPFYIVWFQTCEPYGIRVDCLNNFAYNVVDGIMIDTGNYGSTQLQELIAIHKKCVMENNWMLGDITTPADERGWRIHNMECPLWAKEKVIRYYI